MYSNDRYLHLFSLYFLNSLYQYKHYNIHDYFLYKHSILKFINYKQILLMPFRTMIIFRINNKISKPKYKFFSFFLKKKELNIWSYKNYYLNVKYYKLNYGRLYFFRRTRFYLKLIQKFKFFK